MSLAPGLPLMAEVAPARLASASEAPGAVGWFVPGRESVGSWDSRTLTADAHTTQDHRINRAMASLPQSSPSHGGGVSSRISCIGEVTPRLQQAAAKSFPRPSARPLHRYAEHNWYGLPERGGGIHG